MAPWFLARAEITHALWAGQVLLWVHHHVIHLGLCPKPRDIYGQMKIPRATTDRCRTNADTLVENFKLRYQIVQFARCSLSEDTK